MSEELKLIAWAAYCGGRLCDVTRDEGIAKAWQCIGGTVVVPLYDRHIPEGFTLVPVEPTLDMLRAMVMHSDDDLEEIAVRYERMLSAAHLATE